MSPRGHKKGAPRSGGPVSRSASADDALARYRAKRSAAETPEPFGGEVAGAGGQGLFVVQKHAARRTHYDLRLELSGVLKSWAVPRGPSLDPKERRLAVETEDHPLEYSDFEGVIPDGNYGAGAMIVWDRGRWTALEDPVAGYRSGKLLFELFGYKLRGVWTLFRTRPPLNQRGKSKDEDKQWLLMKKPDAAAAPEGARELPETSIYSGLTVEELGAADQREKRILDRLVELGARRRPVDPRTFDLTLAQPAEQPFSRPGWLYELKYDGYRLLASKRDGEPYLRYRNGLDATGLFPELGRALAALPGQSLVVDGEVVVLDASGRPSFNQLQKRALLSRPLDIERAAVGAPATFFGFDLVAFEGFDLRPLPLSERKALLATLLPAAGPLRYLDHIEERGVELYSQIEHMGLEGMVAKKADAPYPGRRSGSWLKYRVDQAADFAIVGWSRPARQRQGFGALHVAVWDDDGGGLRYAGRVGTGFNDNLLRELGAMLEARKRATPPCTGELPRGDRHAWVEPGLVCEVRFKEWTPQGLLRHPVFVRLRDDKSVEECRRDAVGPRSQVAEPSLAANRPQPAPPPQTPTSKDPELQLTNLDKVFWPAEGYTKGDLIDYYRKVSPWILRYLNERPVVLTRFPDGIEGKSFFQKHAPDFAPSWIRTETIWSEGSERDIDYFVCNDERSLLYLANLGTIPLHVWSSRMATLEHPDWCILDLDPKGAPFVHVVEIAREIHDLCRKIGLPSFPKTSGSSGIHVLLPLGRSCSYEQSRTLGMLIAEVTARKRPDIATVARTLEKRDGKVYIDFVQNGHGRLLVAPLCLRPLPGAPVSTPLSWREVTAELDPHRFNLRTVPARLARQRRDPMAAVLEEEPDLVAALGRLSELV